LETHSPYPFLSNINAYVVHGYDDQAVPLEHSLTWTRDASGE